MAYLIIYLVGHELSYSMSRRLDELKQKVEQKTMVFIEYFPEISSYGDEM